MNGIIIFSLNSGLLVTFRLVAMEEVVVILLKHEEVGVDANTLAIAWVDLAEGEEVATWPESKLVRKG